MDNRKLKQLNFHFRGYGAGLILVAVLLTACGDPTVTAAPAATTKAATTAAATTAAVATVVLATPVTSVAPPAPSPNTQTGGNSVPDEIKKSYEAAASDLAKKTNIAAAEVKLMGYSREEFRDASLGCPQPDAFYSQVITPGYRFQLEAKGQLYDYRTNLQGTRVVLCTNGGQPGLPKSTP